MHLHLGPLHGLRNRQNRHKKQSVVRIWILAAVAPVVHGERELACHHVQFVCAQAHGLVHGHSCHADSHQTLHRFQHQSARIESVLHGHESSSHSGIPLIGLHPLVDERRLQTQLGRQRTIFEQLASDLLRQSHRDRTQPHGSQHVEGSQILGRHRTVCAVYHPGEVQTGEHLPQ